jgi:hypothetical protein
MSYTVGRQDYYRTLCIPHTPMYERYSGRIQYVIYKSFGRSACHKLSLYFPSFHCTRQVHYASLFDKRNSHCAEFNAIRNCKGLTLRALLPAHRLECAARSDNYVNLAPSVRHKVQAGWTVFNRDRHYFEPASKYMDVGLYNACCRKSDYGRVEPQSVWDVWDTAR